ncbi:specific transcriptional repressor [Gigaspora margarita]|uniref:Specific transcriptional repressor n=1 Tax=Gigaspora margarita TaxID=4874 RepID=A0A8H4ATK1_GIGMA|nr:specific transcriptional repressor [Gigaspora margarita]
MASRNNATLSIPTINFGKFEFLLSKLTEEELQIIRNPPLTLFLTIEELFAPAKRPTKSPNPPRSLNSYFLWRRNYDASRPTKSCIERSQETGLMWSRTDDKVKHFFKTLSEIHKIYHKLKYPEYKYNPKRIAYSKDFRPADDDNEIQESSLKHIDPEGLHIDINDGHEVWEHFEKLLGPECLLELINRI